MPLSLFLVSVVQIYSPKPVLLNGEAPRAADLLHVTETDVMCSGSTGETHSQQT